MMFNLYTSTPAVIFGPGDVTLVHAPDEYIEVEQLILAAKCLADVIIRWGGVA
jgi:acetylornithine deacetylase